MNYISKILDFTTRYVKRTGLTQTITRSRFIVGVFKSPMEWIPVRIFVRYISRMFTVVVSRKFKTLPTHEHYLQIIIPPIGWTTWGDDGVYPWLPPIADTPFSGYP